jgi:hypothetical protein
MTRENGGERRHSGFFATVTAPAKISDVIFPARLPAEE